MKLVLTFLLLASSLSAKDIYVAQNSAGGDTGADASNAHSVVWFNTAGNWGSGAGQISPGDTVHLCGTITNTLTVQAGGSAGNIVTILFESGAKLSAATWTNCVLNLNGKNYLTVNGGANGLIEATDNGDGKTHHNNFDGIEFSAASYVIIQNLSISNLQTHVQGSSDTQDGCTAISLWSANTWHNVTIRNCIISGARTGIGVGYMTNYDWAVYSNTIAHCANAIYGGGGNANATMYNIHIYDNRIDYTADWDTPSDTFHEDGIYLWADNANNTLSNVWTYNNVIGPNLGAGPYTTAGIYYSASGAGSKAVALQIYNNVLYSPSMPADGFLYLLNATANVFNNTFVNTGTQASFPTVLYSSSSVTYLNNIFVNFQMVPCYTDGSAVSITSDYNDFYNCQDNYGGWSTAYTAWKALGHDTHSIQADPIFASQTNADFQLQAGSPAIGTGTNLSGIFTADAVGKARPSSGAWDIGPYQYGTNAVATNAVFIYHLEGVSGGGFRIN